MILVMLSLAAEIVQRVNIFKETNAAAVIKTVENAWNYGKMAVKYTSAVRNMT